MILCCSLLEMILLVNGKGKRAYSATLEIQRRTRSSDRVLFYTMADRFLIGFMVY